MQIRSLNNRWALCFRRSNGSRQSNNAEMNGNYAFTFSGMTTGGGDAFTPFSAAGRFTADGAGNLTAGELDTNGVGIPEKLVAQPFNGTYQIGADHRGVMDLNIPGGGTLAFVMLANGNAKFVEIDASAGMEPSAPASLKDPTPRHTTRPALSATTLLVWPVWTPEMIARRLQDVLPRAGRECSATEPRTQITEGCSRP